MKPIFNCLFVFYVVVSLIFSNFILSFDRVQIFGLTISVLTFGLIWISYKKFINTRKEIYLLSVESIVIFRVILISFGLRSDTHNAIKNEELLYLASGLLTFWCLCQHILQRNQRSVL